MGELKIPRRTNNEWIENLYDPVDEQALSDLQSLLLHGLRSALKGSITKDLDLRIEEFTQLALIKIQEDLPLYSGAGNFTTWVLKIAIHLAFAALRYEKFVEEYLDKTNIPGKRKFSISRIPKNLEYDLARKQIQSHILEVINCSIENDLTESQRAVLFAVYQQGLSERDSARQLGISSDELGNQLASIRIHIRKLICEKLDLSPWDVMGIFGWPYHIPKGADNQHPDNKIK